MSTVYFLCPDHAPTPQPDLAARAPASYLGQHVKRAFPGGGQDRGRVEHMWVLIERVTPGGVLEGRLANDPYFDVGYHAGDTVLVLLTAIEDVLERE